MRLHMRELPTRFLLFCAKVLSLRANRGPRTRVVRYFRSPATCAARATLAPRHLLKCGVDCDSVTPKTGPPWSPHGGALSLGTRKGNPMNWLIFRTGLLIAVLATAFNLGRLSIEFNGTGSDWAVLISGVVTLICSLIGLAAGELVRAQPKKD